MTQIIENLSKNVVLTNDKPLNINGNNFDGAAVKAKNSNDTIYVVTSSGKGFIYYVN